MPDTSSSSHHEFDRHLHRTGYYPTAHFKSIGLIVRVAPGYITIKRQSTPEIYIPYRQLIRLIRWLTPLIRRMDPALNFDPQVAVTQYLQDELDLRAELRRQKRQRYGSRRSRRRA